MLFLSLKVIERPWGCADRRDIYCLTGTPADEQAERRDEGGQKMLVTFWGTRGSIPKPGLTTLKYGGNTLCVQITSSQGDILIIDCGTGAYNLGIHLMSQHKEPIKGNLCFSHTHWDHIQGVPFFAPFFDGRGQWDVYGPYGFGQSIQDSLKGQMLHQYFPISLKEFGATIHYHDLVEGAFSIGNLNIKTQYLNHTALTLGFRIESEGFSVVYACDHEPFSKHLAGGEGIISGQDLTHLEFLKDADVVIHDSQYFPDEYAKKVGWGHSTPEYAIKICREANVKHLILTHHDPMRTDKELDDLNERIQEQLLRENIPMKVTLAYEGLEIPLPPEKIENAEYEVTLKEPETSEEIFLKKSTLQSALVGYSVLILCSDFSIVALLEEAAELEGITPYIFLSLETAKAQIKELKPSLIIVEHTPPAVDGISLARELHNEALAYDLDPPLIMVTSEAVDHQYTELGVVDCLHPPFTCSYARTKIGAWVLRMQCDWTRAVIPKEEETKRLEDLKSLCILDTPREERFDRITKLAAELFNVPVAAISFVDKDRQWFKSSQGLEILETPREVSFCEHVVSSRKPVVVYDAFLDKRFSGNPCVVSQLRVRFYVGFPLVLENGSIVGTLCLMDTKPRYISKERLILLGYLRDMVVKELSANKK